MARSKLSWPEVLTRTAAEASDDWQPRLEQMHQAARAAGFTTDAGVYQRGYREVFDRLDDLDELLHHQRFLSGATAPGRSDWYLACWLVRFEPVYYPLYKLNRQRLRDFENLAHYLRDMAARAPFRGTLDMEAIKRTHYLENDAINPKRRIPLTVGPDLLRPHDRDLRFAVSEESAVEEDPQKPRASGEWVRKQSRHRHWITRDGRSDFPAEPGRYHLYVSNNCPWSHRARLTRSLKGLEEVISMDVLYFRRDPERGWQFRPEEPGCTADSIHGYRYITELYERVGSPERSVPVLWDKQTETIVSNESADIIRMFDEVFDGGVPSPKLCPASLRPQIDRINAWTYHAVNNGAYKAGFASGQEAYEAAHTRLFDALRLLDEMLAGRRFLLGDRLTEADVRLFPTIFRFDPIYYTRFHLDAAMVEDHHHLQAWLNRMQAIEAVRDASNLDHCRRGYFGRTGNNIVPLGPSGFETQ